MPSVMTVTVTKGFMGYTYNLVRGATGRDTESQANVSLAESPAPASRRWQPVAALAVFLGVFAGTSSYFIMSFVIGSAVLCETAVSSPFLVAEQSDFALTLNNVRPLA